MLLCFRSLLRHNSCIRASQRVTAAHAVRNDTEILVSACSNVQHKRDYRKFGRFPKDVRPAEKDIGKIGLDEYMDKTSRIVNEEVLKEAAALSYITKNVSKHNENEFPAAGDNRDRKHNDQPNLAKFWNKSGTDNTQSKKSAEEKDDTSKLDPEIQAALNKINTELYDKARPVYRKLLTRCSTPKHRREENAVMLEGAKMIREALSAGLLPEAVYYSRKKLLLDMMPLHMSLDEKIERISALKCFSTAYKKLNTWSSVVKSQGLIAVFRLSDVASAPILRSKEAFPQIAGGCSCVVVVDGVREPGNLGSILRTVAAVGATRVLLIKGCCDPWEGKALRAASGGHFSLHITTGVSWGTVHNSLPTCPTVFVADVCNADREAMRDDDVIHPEDYDHETQSLLTSVHRRRLQVAANFAAKDRQNIGEDASECRDTSGVGSVSYADRNNLSEIDSRNKDSAATFEEEEENDEAFVDSTLCFEVDEDGKEYSVDPSYDDLDHLKRFANKKFPCRDYNEIEYYPPTSVLSTAPEPSTNDDIDSKINSSSEGGEESNDKQPGLEEIVLVIGSETGVSNGARKFVHENHGLQVSVPLSPAVDSLNTSVAVGVILYEVRRQAISVPLARQRRDDDARQRRDDAHVMHGGVLQ